MIQLALTILIDLIWLFLQVFISIMSLQEGIPLPIRSLIV